MNRIINLYLLTILVLLPGCGRISEFVEETFPQGQEWEKHKKTTKRYIRQVNIYDQFNTIGLFDALWLSDEMRSLYADVNADMHGKNTQTKYAFLRRQLKENAHFISFYVLSTHNNPLSIKPVPWALYLLVDGKKYMPFEVKAVELPTEYKMIFGSLFNKHKVPYEVRFERNNAEGIDILKEGHTHDMQLFFSTPSHYACAKWNITNQGIVSIVEKNHQPIRKHKKKHSRTQKKAA